MPSFNVGRQPEPDKPGLTPERRKQYMDEAFDALSEDGINRMMRSVWDHINNPDSATSWLRVAHDPEHEVEAYDITDKFKEGLRERGFHGLAADVEFIALGKLHSQTRGASDGEVACRMMDGSTWHPMGASHGEVVAVMNSIKDAATSVGWSEWSADGQSFSPWEIDRQVEAFASTIGEGVNDEQHPQPDPD